MEREELERLWRGRVAAARRHYASAREALKGVERDFTSPDGSYAYMHALRIETTALSKYGHVLGIFVELVMHGKIPNEDEWQAMNEEA